jgi:glycosyltransferase involved in cell wall biosynthesis
MKDHATFLRAATRFAAVQPDCRFVLCGEGINHDNETLASLIRDAGLGDRVILLGVRGDMERVYPAFDVLTLSSAYGEGFPNVLIEAMSCGVPCVATDAGDSREVVGDAGLIVPPRDAAALADAWGTHREAVSTALAERIRQRATQSYSIEGICARYEAVYEEIAAASVQPAAAGR